MRNANKRFSMQIERFAEETKQQATKRMNDIVMELYGNIRDRTPVDTEELRKSWTVAYNTMVTNFNGSVSLPTRITNDGFYSIGTDKVYAPIIEYGLYPNPPEYPTGKTINGFSTQAPQGMVRVSIADITIKYGL